MDLENFPKSEGGKRLLGRVSSDFYAKSYVGKWLYQVMGEEMDSLREIVESLPDQEFVDTATWGLDYWELMYGLDIRRDMSESWRRSRIHELRDILVPPTPSSMEHTIESITGRRASVKDCYEDKSLPPNVFTVEVKDGPEPVDISKVRSKIDELKQSHTSYTLYQSIDVGIVVQERSSEHRARHTLTGTVPRTSTGGIINRDSVEVLENPGSYNSVHYKAGMIAAGTIPRMSTGAIINLSSVEMNTEDGSHVSVHEKTGLTTSGTKPRESIGTALSSGEVLVDTESEENLTIAEIAGSNPETSTGLSSSENGMSFGTSVESYSAKTRACGTQSPL